MVGLIWVTEIAGNVISGYAFDALFFTAFGDPLSLRDRCFDLRGFPRPEYVASRRFVP